MPVHEPAPSKPTDTCPKCGAKGTPELRFGDMTSYRCPKCGTTWMATTATR